MSTPNSEAERFTDITERIETAKLGLLCTFLSETALAGGIERRDMFSAIHAGLPGDERERYAELFMSEVPVEDIDDPVTGFAAAYDGLESALKRRSPHTRHGRYAIEGTMAATSKPAFAVFTKTIMSAAGYNFAQMITFTAEEDLLVPTYVAKPISPYEETTRWPEIDFLPKEDVFQTLTRYAEKAEGLAQRPNAVIEKLVRTHFAKTKKPGSLSVLREAI